MCYNTVKPRLEVRPCLLPIEVKKKNSSYIFIKYLNGPLLRLQRELFNQGVPRVRLQKEALYGSVRGRILKVYNVIRCIK